MDDRTMKAAVVHEFGKPLAIEEVQVPRPGAGQVLVKIRACGVCHTDLHAAEGDWPVKPKPPFIPGHEGVGHVVAVGAGTFLATAPGRAVVASLAEFVRLRRGAMKAGQKTARNVSLYSLYLTSFAGFEASGR